MKSRQSKRLVVAGFALAGLIALFLLALLLLKEDETPPGNIPVFSADIGTIKRISVAGGETGEDYALVRDGTEADGTPKFSFENPDTNFQYYEDAFIRVPRAVSNVVADREVEKTADEAALQKYGLSPAVTTVTVELEGGSAVRFLLGTLAGTNDGYYMMLEGGDTVYKISTDTHLELAVPESYYRNFEILPEVQPSLTDLAYVKFTLPDGTVAFEAETPSFQPKSFDGRATSLYIEQPLQDYCSLAALWNKALSYLYEQTEHYGYVEDYPKNLAEYGLENCYRLEIRNTKGEELNLRLATEKNENGYYYAYKEGQPSVIQLSGQFQFFQNDALSYVAPSIWLYEANGIASAEITGKDGAKHILDYNRTEAEGDIETATLDGKPLSEKNVRNFYTRVISLSMVGACEPEDSAPALTVALNLVNGERHELKLRPINEREFAAELDGETRYMVNIEGVRGINEALENLLSGKDIE